MSSRDATLPRFVTTKLVLVSSVYADVLAPILVVPGLTPSDTTARYIVVGAWAFVPEPGRRSKCSLPGCCMALPTAMLCVAFVMEVFGSLSCSATHIASPCEHASFILQFGTFIGMTIL